jgi:prepilin-type N-terminal cleavage/methylation domain-containing protein
VCFSRRTPRFRRVPAGGYTLVEIVIVLLIVGIASAVLMPRYQESLARHRAASAAKRIMADVELVRQTAIARSQTQTLEFKTGPDGNGYAVQGLSGLDHPALAYEVDLAAAPYQATLVSADCGGDGDLQFDQFGTPDSGGELIVESGGVEQKIVIDAATGRATLP